MATVLETPTTDIVLAVEATPQIVLLDSAKFSAFYAKLKADIEATPVDLKTDKGRKAIASAAAKVRTEKASIDRDRKRLTQEWRDMTAQVNGAWKTIETQLDELAVEARRPLTEWEAAEKARVDLCREWIGDFKHDAIVTLDDTAETVRNRGAHVWGRDLDPEKFGDLLPEAQAAKDHAVEALKSALARLTREEAERAELEKLRAEAAERERIDAERRATEEAAQRAAEEAQRQQEQERLAEERRIAAQQAEQERIARAEQEAEARAKRQAEEAAQAERDRIQREHDQAIAAERRRAEEAEQAIQAERARAAQEEDARVAKAEAEAAEQAKRDKNRKHRAQIMGEAKLAIMAAGSIDDAAAVAIVKAIVAGSVPHTSLRF